jgi:Flp pilus assembly protein TadG
MRFWRDRRGNVAIMFALAVVPVVGAMGAALDYSLANSYRTDMQKALDAAALAVSKVMPLEQVKLDKIALQYFTAGLGNHSLSNIKVSVVPDQGHAKLLATGDYSPKMASLFGIDKFVVGVTSEARWGIGKVEVALVLDNSGSMSDYGRMTHLKAAATDLLKVLEGSVKNPGDAKVAIVPFDSGVRVKYTQANAPAWVKWGDTGTCSIRPSNLKSRNDCVSAGGVWTWSTWTSTKWASWSGCVEDRDYNASASPPIHHSVLDTAPDTTTSMSAAALQTRYPAKSCDSNSLRTVTPLTDNWEALKTEIANMQPSGYTNISIGMAWGWHVLSPTPLYTEGAAYGTKDLTKFVILMTDGDNTRSRHSNESTTINARTSTVCTNIKAAGIKIYSIRLVEGNANLIKNCASEPGMYFDVRDASVLSGVFKTIASQIASLHLSK